MQNEINEKRTKINDKKTKSKREKNGQPLKTKAMKLCRCNKHRTIETTTSRFRHVKRNVYVCLCAPSIKSLMMMI